MYFSKIQKLTVPFDHSGTFAIPVPRSLVFSVEDGGSCGKLHFHLSVQPLRLVDNGFVRVTCSTMHSFNRYVAALKAE